jgi:amino acid transporter
MTEKLKRVLSRWDLVAIVINIVIGAGIFGLPAKVYKEIGSYSLLAFVGCALIIGLVVLCFAEVSSRFDSTGGMYLYAKEAFGPVVGFEAGWLMWVVRVTTFAANCNLMLDYLAGFNEGINKGGLRVGLIVMVVAIFALVNLLGIRQSSILNNIFTVGKIVPLLVFVAVGLFFIQPANFSFGAAPEYDKFSSAILLLIYAFVGFEYAVTPAGEAREPKKDLPFALLVGLGFVAVLFILIQIVAIGTYPDLANSQRPLADAAGVFMGAAGAAFITVGAAVSIFGNLNGGFLVASRIPFAMAEQKELPGIFSATHERFKTPYFSLAVTSVVILILTINSSFLTALTLASITRLLVYATTCGALPIFRLFGQRKGMPEAEFKAPLGVLVSLLSLGLIAWLLLNVDFVKEGLPILIAIMIGLFIGLLNEIFRKFFSADRS